MLISLQRKDKHGERNYDTNVLYLIHEGLPCKSFCTGVNYVYVSHAISTGVSPGEGTGATMSDDNDDQIDSDTNFFDGSLEGHDSMNYGPLVPTESERSLMERVRQELKHELKEVRC